LPEPSAYDQVFRATVQKGHVFTEITPARASLEEVFLRLTKSEENGSANGNGTAEGGKAA
ncbi:MAG TPA: hypothetical protein VIV61_03170, partial [Candidatus Ozemobacteraceae bacterium]